MQQSAFTKVCANPRKIVDIQIPPFIGKGVSELLRKKSKSLLQGQVAA